jgi:hypothetical protein
MNKIAAYNMVLRRHPLWETEYQEKEAGIAALGLNTAARGIGSAAKAFMAGSRGAPTASIGLLQGVRGAAQSGGIHAAFNTPIGQFARQIALPY